MIINQVRKPLKSLSRFFCLMFVLCLFASFMSFPVYAEPSWPEMPGIQADGGILVDMASGTVLYEKNADQPYYPASITKILTALIIVENCNLEDMVTFSDHAVNDVESGSSNMGALPGDQLTVRDCLYGLMLASANECANALAEYYSGSIENFVEVMNQRALELGCKGSHFANPSGLNHEDHYVTARDMAIITKAAVENPLFLEIDGSLYWQHAPIKRYPDPEDPHNTVYAHHGMLKKNNANYYSGAFAGKTGYTSLAGNTLVTCARKNDMTLICVVLNGHQTHYQDTKALFDFGFRNFNSIQVSDYNSTYTSIENDMTIAGITASPISTLSMDEDCFIVLPQSAGFNDIETSLNYQLSDSAPAGTIAEISYTYAGRPVGSCYLMLKSNRNSLKQMEMAATDLTRAETVGIPEPTTKALENRLGQEGMDSDSISSSLGLTDSDSEELSDEKEFRLNISSTVWVALALTVILAGVITAVVVTKIHIQRKTEAEVYRLRERRKKRLNDIGLTPAEFDLVIQERKHSSYQTQKNRRYPKKPY